jgi:zinc protease
VTKRFLRLALVLVLGCGHGAGKPAAPAPAAPASASARQAPPGPGPAGTPAGPDETYWKNRTDLIQPPAPPKASELSLPPIERWRLENGLDIIAVPRAGLPLLTFSVAVRAGGYDEQKGRTQGVADFTAAMLRKGTRKRGAEQISEAIDRVGGVLGASSDMESTMVSCSVLAKDAALCLDLLSEMLLRPTFPEGEMPEVRDQMLAALGQRVDDPHQLAAEFFDNLLFGEDHPDGWSLEPEHVRAINRAALQTFWKTYYRPNNALLAVTGAFDAATIKAAVERAFGGWRAEPVPVRPTWRVPESTGKHVVLVDKPDLSQATLMFGHRGIRHGDTDWYAITLANYVLGGSDFSSRLMIEVRSRRGLTYGIGSSFGASLYQGAFRISAATRNETAGQALAVATDELRKMKTAGPTVQELAKAKGYYAGSTPFQLESAAGIGHAIVAAELHGLGVDYVRKLALNLASVDLGSVRAAARARLHPDNLAIVLVGRAATLEPQLRAAGLPFERVDYRASPSAAVRRRAATNR